MVINGNQSWIRSFCARGTAPLKHRLMRIKKPRKPFWSKSRRTGFLSKGVKTLKVKHRLSISCFSRSQPLNKKYFSIQNHLGQTWKKGKSRHKGNSKSLCYSCKEQTKKIMKQRHLHYLPSCTIQTEKRSTKRIAGPDLANPMARSVQDSIIQIAATWASARLRRSIIWRLCAALVEGVPTNPL